MNWHKVGNILPDEADGVQRRAQVDGSWVCKLWGEYSRKLLLNKAMSAHEAINFRDGVLTIEVSDPTYIEDIKRYQSRIVRLINKTLEGELIKKIRYLA